MDPVMGDHGKPTAPPSCAGVCVDLAGPGGRDHPQPDEGGAAAGVRTPPIRPGRRGAAGVAERLSLDGRRSVVLTRVSLGRAPSARAASTGPQGASALLWPGRSPPSSPEPAIFSPAWCWGDRRGSRWRQRPSGRRSLSSGAQPTPWRWARFWRVQFEPLLES